MEFKTQQDLVAYKAHTVARADERLAALGLGPRTDHMGMIALPPGPWSTPAAAAMAGKKLVITGAPGTTKTTLAKRVAWGLALRRWRPRGGYLPSILEKIKSPECGAFMEWVRDGDLLVLDDLDKLRGTHHEGEKILAMLNHYDANGLPVIATLNVDLDGFKKRIGDGGIPQDYVESIMSRLMCRMEPWHMTGPDMRKAQ